MSDLDGPLASGQPPPASQCTASHERDEHDAHDARDDAELVRAAREDRAAFAALYRRHLSRVYRFLLARLGDAHQAQDATAQTFLAALEGLDGYRGQGPFIAWLLTIARHKAADLCRERRPALSLDAAADVPSAGPAVEREVAARLRLEEVVRAMRVLTPDRAEALALRIFAGLSLAEVAAIMDKNEAAVKMLVHRAVRDLRARLEPGNEAEP